MSPSHDTDSRLTALEIKLSFTEELVDSLNQTIYEQQQQLALLWRELRELRRQAQQPAGAGLSLRDELPPHY